jgi:predicted RNA-binding protein
MRKTIAIIASFLFMLGGISAQDAPKPTYFMGDVTTISGEKLVLQTKDGAVEITLQAATTYKKVPPDNPKLAAATDATLADIGAGDKVIVSSIVPADKKMIPARTVYLMTKADISKRNEAESAAWRARGISGRVVSIDLPNKKLVLAMRGMGGERNVALTPKDSAEYRRYAPDSVRFQDAKPSNFAELAVGDQVRALGDRSADGAEFTAEKIVFGSFKMVGGTITAIDAAKNEITIKDIQTNKPVTIVVKDTTVLKKFPLEMAQMMAMRMMGGGGAGVQPPNQGGNAAARPPSQGQGAGNPQNAGNGNGGGGGMRPAGGGGRGEFDDLLERFPSVSLAELKPGDAIAASSTAGAVPDRVTAIKLVSGVEPFFAAPQMQRGGAGGGQSAPSLNIPGLDGGIGFP